MKKKSYLVFLKISYFIFILLLHNNNLIASLSQYNPIYEKDQMKKKEICQNALKRFVNPFYIYYNGEMIEKIFMSFTILGIIILDKLTKNKNTGQKEGRPLTNTLLHLFLCAFFAQWLVIGPAKIFIDSYLEEYDRKFKAKL